MNFFEAVNSLENKIVRAGNALTLPTLGNRRKIRVTVNRKGKQSIIIENSKGTIFQVNEKDWNTIQSWREGLADHVKDRTGYYEIPHFSLEDGNIKPIMSPYLAAVMHYLEIVG